MFYKGNFADYLKKILYQIETTCTIFHDPHGIPQCCKSDFCNRLILCVFKI